MDLSKILYRITHRLITRDPPILGNEEDLPLEKSERKKIKKGMMSWKVRNGDISRKM